MITRAEMDNIHGIKISRGSPLITHIMFADNLIIFCKANERDALEVKKVLDLFCKLSRQSINQEKSSIHYSQNVDRKTKEKLNGILAIGKGNHKSTYLGMPFCKRRSKKQAFSKG